MTKSVDYDSRKRLVLAAVVNRHIKDINPVSSSDIANEFSLSPATIRNIFAELERDGYLTHPYTSAGRIPTDKGYRYYVDFLLSQMELMSEEKDAIIREYKKRISKKIEDVLERTSEVISEVTHYTGIVSLLDWHDKVIYKGISLILDEPEFRDINRIRQLLDMFEEKRRLLNLINREFKNKAKVKIYIGSELDCFEIDNCALVISTYRFKDKPLGRVAVLGPKRMQYRHTIPALEYISEVLSDALQEI